MRALRIVASAVTMVAVMASGGLGPARADTAVVS